MYDVDGDGFDDRITAMTLDKDERDAVLCIQFANGTTPDSVCVLSDGYSRMHLSVGAYEDYTLIYIDATWQGSSGEQLVHPFIYNPLTNKLTPVINPASEHMADTDMLNLPCFSDPVIGKSNGDGTITVETEYAGTLFLSVPEIILSEKKYDEEYGLRIVSQECEMSVDADNNQVKCSLLCAVIDPESCHLDEATPVTLNVVFEFDGETFAVKSWKYDVMDGVEYSTEEYIPAPSPVPGDTTSPTGMKYADTISITQVEGKTVSVRADLDGDGSEERIDVETDDDYNSLLRVYNADGKKIFNIDGFYIRAHIADLTADGRLILIVERNTEDEISQITFYTMKDGKLKQLKADFADTYENEVWGYIADVRNGEITFEFRSDIMGTRFWTHTAYLDKNEIKLSESDYIYPDDQAFVLKQDIKAEDKDGKEVKLRKGAELIPVSSDFVSYVWYRDESGRMLKMTVTKDEDDWMYYINGIAQNDLFENIQYAG